MHNTLVIEESNRRRAGFVAYVTFFSVASKKKIYIVMTAA
jgi:hypothetical protein